MSLDSDEIDVRKLFEVLWSGKWIVGTITSLSAAISVTVALALPNIYTATALLAPAQQSTGGFGGLMQQYGGLASLAGVALPGGNDAAKTQHGIQLLKSKIFLADFVDRRGLKPLLFAVEAWDKTNNRITFDANVYDSERGIWFLEDDSGSGEPSSLMASKKLMELLSVAEDRRTGFVRVSIRHQSPRVAAKWVDWLVADVNSEVRGQDIKEATQSIKYLEDQVTKTSLAELQTVFFELIQSQTETVMLANVRPEYVFKVIDPAVAPEDRSSPNRAQFCITWTLLGMVLGVAFVLVRSFVSGKH